MIQRVSYAETIRCRSDFEPPVLIAARDSGNPSGEAVYVFEVASVLVTLMRGPSTNLHHITVRIDGYIHDGGRMPMIGRQPSWEAQGSTGPDYEWWATELIRPAILRALEAHPEYQISNDYQGLRTGSPAKEGTTA